MPSMAQAEPFFGRRGGSSSCTYILVLPPAGPDLRPLPGSLPGFIPISYLWLYSPMGDSRTTNENARCERKLEEL